ncbi:MAG: ATP-binding cassette domain-containing protein [Gammaproteobacteria bacterium]|nr:ATP-binding cassette domain-containing protein [Gammaproteobacteria bacterium]
MALLSLDKVSLAYGHVPLLAQVTLQIELGERVCLIGRNGTGKSTLFKVITGVAQPDEGMVWRRDTLRISHLEQEVTDHIPQTVFDVVAGGLGALGKLFADYHHALHADQHDQNALHRLSELQQQIEVHGAWNIQQKVETILSKLHLPEDKFLADCSGGLRRRVMLARALVSDPDVLLLDEPTNHMDITAITWLEGFLREFRGALIFITHDRTFLKNLATRIIELDRGKLSSFPGDYENYQRRKAEMLHAEEKAHAKFDKFLAEEEVWIRQGIKARRTRNEGRVRRLIDLRQERNHRLSITGKVSMQVDSGEASGKLVTDFRHVSFAYAGRNIIQDFSTRILRGDRIGIIGPNGSGKSTLLRLILGELRPQSGQVILGTKLEAAYFDQHREQLNLDKTVRNNLCEGSDYVDVRGKPRHVISYLRDFLFPAARINAPVRVLSGGERNRLLLAKIFTRSANLLVLDEPTNDLDVDTLELLEDLLSDYDGTLLLVSHDRAFLDNVVSSTIVFEGEGQLHEYVGGYEDWLRQRRDSVAANGKSTAVRIFSADVPTAAPEGLARPKLSYKQSRELDALPQQIEQLEYEQTQLQQQIADPTFYRQNKAAIGDLMARLTVLEQTIQAAYMRWEQLSK